MDACPKNHERFVDLDKCVELIEALNTKLGPLVDNQSRCRMETERLVEAFRKTIDSYQEQPELLDPYLAELIEKLTSSLRESKKSGCIYHTTFKFLYQLIKVTGFKSIGRKFPHETDKLYLLVDLLEKEDPDDKSNWQTRFGLTVWLSIVILMPFDLAKFDTNSANGSIAQRIYTILTRNLALHDSSQHVTGFCLAKFLSRPDVLKSDFYPNKFISSALNELANVKTGSANSMDDIQLIGYLRTLNYMFNFLPRVELKNRCPEILRVLATLDIEKINRELVNHLIIKLVQRCGLALLPKPVACWRYKRGSRILGQLSDKEEGESVQPASEYMAKDNSPTDNEDEVNAAEYLETILNTLFVAAQNSQTRIRWSAAKGIARLASRLSRERASDVIDMVISSFFDTKSSEFAWHGGCLTLAEMSRHGLILEEKLEAITRIVGDAIIYDKIKGSFAVGSHVREAACYVFWAMARTYEDHLLAPYISSISINLLCTMLFDRELQCRRAASATFQELVGRQGTFSEEGIGILTNVDYQNVGQRQLSYLQLALQVASYSAKYSEAFVGHLLEKKIGHWDIQIRRLSSDSLSALMLHTKNDFTRSVVIPKLIEMTVQKLDNNVKHGAILGLSKVIRGLIPLQYEFDEDLIDFVGGLAKECDKQLKSKQQAPNFIEAIAQSILSAELAQFSYDQSKSETLKQWESIALSALDSDNASLRDIGSDALLTLYRTYYKADKTSQDRLLTILNKSLVSQNESSRCGSLRALSKLGRVDSVSGGSHFGGEKTRICLDAETPDIILMSLASYIGKETRERPSDIVFAQAKAEACDALVNFVRSLDKSRLIVSSSLLSASFDALLEKTEDYTFDKRGDIGVVVRRASVKALEQLTLYLMSIELKSPLDSRRVTKIIGKTLQQAVSYHNTTRELASSAFYNLVTCEKLSAVAEIPHRDEIQRLFEKYQVDDEFNWRDDSTPIFVNLLDKPEYSMDLWIGLLPSVGQVSDMGAKQFREALGGYLVSLSESPEMEPKRSYVFESFLDTLEHQAKTASLAEKLLNSGLIATDYLLTEGLMSRTGSDFQNRLAKFCWQARVPNDPKRLLSIGRVLCSMLQFSGQVQLDCLMFSLQLLLSGYSKVRAYIAEQLYQSIMTYQSELEETLSSIEMSAAHNDERPELAVDVAMDLLSQTNWAETLDKLKPVCDQICSSLLVKLK